MAGGSGIQTDTQLILTGGVNYRIFKNALDGKAGKDYLTHAPLGTNLMMIFYFMTLPIKHGPQK